MFANRFAAKLTSLLVTIEFANRFAALLTTKTSEVSPLQSIKLFGNKFKQEYMQRLLSESVLQRKVAIFMHGGHFNKEKSMISKQFASVADCVGNFMLAKKCIDTEFLNFG